MTRGSISWILLVAWFAVFALSTVFTGIGLTFAGWPVVLGIIALLFVIFALLGR